MFKSINYFLMIALALSLGFFFACAESIKSGRVVGRVLGDCKVTGDVSSFEVKCLKEIKDIQMDGRTGTDLKLSIGGKTSEIQKTDANTLKGSSTGHIKLEFEVNHTDGSSSIISVGAGVSGKVLGDCTVTGNVSAFEVKCPKEILDFQMGNFTGTSLSESVGGKTVKINKIDANTLKGSSTGHTKLDFKVNHTDGSFKNLSVRGGAGGKVPGACTVMGTVSAFEVKCPKEILTFQIRGLVLSNLLESVGGKMIQIDKTDANTLKGSSIGHTRLDFKVNHIDGSSSDISVK